MKILSKSQATDWCKERGIQADTGGRRVSLRYPAGETWCVHSRLAFEPGQLVSLAHGLLLQDLPEPDSQDFAGVLVWFRDWDIWNEVSEAAGARMLELVRGGLGGGNTSTLNEGPAHLFTPQEFVDAHALFMIPLVFQWDAYVVPLSGRCITLVSHDAYVQVTARTASIRSRIADRFRMANWTPDDCPPD